MKDQLEALVAQMHSTGILYSEAVREFKKRFIMNVLQQNKGNQCKAAREPGTAGQEDRPLGRLYWNTDDSISSARAGVCG